MNRHAYRRLWIGIAALALGAGGMSSAGAQEPGDAGDPAGTWAGTLDAAGQRLRLVFHIERDSAGALSGTLDSPDQGAYGLALSAVESSGSDSVRFELRMVGGEYTGQLSADGAQIDGSWSQGGGRIPLRLERADPEALAPKRPQEPQPPFPYAIEPVTFDNVEAGVRLAGTLTVPEGEGPFPAVALISGSGPQDRDETVFGHRPFLVLADYLTRRGIAVLRYDDRGIGESTGDFAAATTPDFAEDARAAVEWLREDPRIRPDAIGLVGHSEGAIVAPIAADRSDDVAFVVLLASTGMPGRDLLVDQGEAINRASGLPETVIEQRAAAQAKVLDAVLESEDDSVAAERARAALAEAGLTGAAADAQVQGLVTPWMRYFLVYDPLPALRELDVPALALYGEKDTQVPPASNAPAVEEALREGASGDYTVTVLPGLNHLFQPAGTGAPSEYAGIEETMSPAAMDAIATWIEERTPTD